MGKRVKTKAKVEEEEMEKSTSLRYLSSDEDEANEDLSLEIVERAKRRRGEDSVEFEQTISRSASGVVTVALSRLDGVEIAAGGGEVKKKEKVKKKKKRKKEIEEEEDVDVVKAEQCLVTPSDVDAEAIRIFDNDIMEEESFVRVEDVDLEAIGILDNFVKAEEPLETIAAERSDNVVLRKLLRGPRYFDPPDSRLETCYNCGEEGHIVANCTEEKRKKPCFVCGKFGHGARQCTQGQDCYICKRRGHLAKNCPEKHKGSTQNSKICLRCGDIGHDMLSCKNDYVLDDLEEIQCYICKKFGHLCCANIIDAGSREVSCYNCGQSGHTGLGCAKVRGEMNDAVSPTLCYKCGEEGHFARGCKNSAKSGWWIGEPSTPTQRLSKECRDLRFRSAPHDVGKVHKKKRKSIEGRKIMSSGKSKQRGGWLTDDPGEPKRKAKMKGWTSPSTPAKKDHKLYNFTPDRHLSSSQSPFKKHKIVPGTSSSNASKTPFKHGFSASRFSNSRGHFGNRDF
ncbi:uncharacterized protein LOC131249171 [Magnolia sinica]|uniref:uncharacterized protein LOC131249171 n=1 Tax=Magnolia sinica TaxID=86752 RepID=UPI00265B52D2|nr:uncharacterized protein LOC131249171 [Magnolia sinica]XP_058105764.1 uncharacterized protein LOC131249171 [Magnolia sinica]XP_058105765.1 uncharacterized protein LOC131249171 [Magnolia sinica]